MQKVHGKYHIKRPEEEGEEVKDSETEDDDEDDQDETDDQSPDGGNSQCWPMLSNLPDFQVCFELLKSKRLGSVLF